GVALLAVVAMGLAVWRSYRSLADESFAQAQQLFESSAFVRAEHQYERFIEAHASDERVPQAKVSRELSKAAIALSDDGADPKPIIESLNQLSAKVTAMPALAEQWPLIVTAVRRTARSALDRANRTRQANDLETAGSWISWLHDQERTAARDSDTREL